MEGCKEMNGWIDGRIVGDEWMNGLM